MLVGRIVRVRVTQQNQRTSTSIEADWKVSDTIQKQNAAEAPEKDDSESTEDRFCGAHGLLWKLNTVSNLKNGLITDKRWIYINHSGSALTEGECLNNQTVWITFSLHFHAIISPLLLILCRDHWHPKANNIQKWTPPLFRYFSIDNTAWIRWSRRPVTKLTKKWFIPAPDFGTKTGISFSLDSKNCVNAWHLVITLKTLVLEVQPNPEYGEEI